jgi:Protein of unknown function (DUF3892)
MRYRIICTTHDAKHERILAVGCLDKTGKRFDFTEAEAISIIDLLRGTFYVERPDGHRIDCLVEKSPAGHRFLKTKPDGEIPNNLLALPQCKSAPVYVPPPRIFTPSHSHGTWQC